MARRSTAGKLGIAVLLGLLLLSGISLNMDRTDEAVAQPGAPGPGGQPGTIRGPGGKRTPALSGFRDLLRSGQPLGLEQHSATDAPATRAVGPPLPGQNVRLNKDSSNQPQNEVTVAINPTNPNNIIAGANDYRIGVGQSGFYSSPGTGGAINFAGPGGLDPDGIMPMVNTGFGEAWDAAGDPAIAFNASGRAYFAGLFFQRTAGTPFVDCRNGISMSRSDNGGLTWTRPSIPGNDGIVVYHSNPADCTIIHDKELIAVDRSSSAKAGRVYVTWTRFNVACGGYCESPIYFAESTDGGVTFSAGVEISGNNPSICFFGDFFDPTQLPNDCNIDQFSVPSVGSDGTVYVSFYNCNTASGNPNCQMLMVKCPVANNCASSAGWSTPVKIADVVDSNYPFNVDGRQTLSNSQFRLGQETFNIAIDTSVTPNKLYATWMDNRNGGSGATGNGASGGTNTDIFVSISTDGGATWGAPIKVNQDTSQNDQWWPWIAVAPNSGAAGQWAVCVAYMDRRADPGNKLNEVYASCSINGGATWTDTRLTDSGPQNCVDFGGFPVASGPNAGKSRFIGDYIGLDATRAGTSPRFFASWVDCRNGTAAIRQSDAYGVMFFFKQ